MTALDTVADRRSPDTSSRALFSFGGLLGVIILFWALVGVRRSDVVNPTLQEMARNAALYHHLVPALVALPIELFAVLSWACVALLWVGYLWLVWRLRDRVVSPRLVASGAIGLSVLALLVPPLFTTDIFSYAMFGRLAGVYNLNPYLASALAAARDPLLPYLYWRSIPTPYGPLWTLLSWLMARGAHATPLELVLRFKLLALAAVLVDGWLIYRIVACCWPARAGWAYLAFAWNPLVLVEGVILGHNDVVILALLLASALLLQRRPTAAALGLVASALIKYSTLPLVGVTLARYRQHASWSHRLRALVPAALAGLALVVACYLPFWVGLRGLLSTAEEPGRGINNPLLASLGLLASRLVSSRLASPLALSGVGALLFAGWQLWDLHAHRPRAASATEPLSDDLAAWSRSLTMFLLCWPRIHTWYFLPPLGLALAAGLRHRRLFGQVLVAALLSYVSYLR